MRHPDVRLPVSVQICDSDPAASTRYRPCHIERAAAGVVQHEQLTGRDQNLGPPIAVDVCDGDAETRHRITLLWRERTRRWDALRRVPVDGWANWSSAARSIASSIHRRGRPLHGERTSRARTSLLLLACPGDQAGTVPAPARSPPPSVPATFPPAAQRPARAIRRSLDGQARAPARTPLPRLARR
jgi:hypothetical protein